MWFYLALVSSLVSALAVIVSKRLLDRVSPTLLTWATLLFATPVILVFTIREEVPSLNFLFFLGVTGSIGFYTLAKIIGFKAIKIANLSSIYPLTSLSPIFTLLIALFPPLAERPAPFALVGMIITIFGCYLLNLTAIEKGILAPFRVLIKKRASLLMLLAILIESGVIFFDKVALTNTFPQSSNFTLLVENTLIIIGLLPFLSFQNRGFLKPVLQNYQPFLLLGLLNAAATMLGFAAVGSGDVGIVKTILQFQILFVLLFSFLFFQDRPKTATVVGSLVMILGVVFIKIGSDLNMELPSLGFKELPKLVKVR